jgi:hypothetical protein
MAKTLAELIADAAAADDLAFTGPDGVTFKLSDIRGFRSSVDTETKAAAAQRKEAERVAGEAAQILTALQQAQKEMAANTKKPDEPGNAADWRKNPLYEDIVPVFDELAKNAKDALARSEEMKKSLDTSQAIYALERMRRQWAEAPIKPKDKKFEEVVQEVLAAHELDNMGLPTVEKYLYRATEADRIKAAEEKAVAAARVDWDKQKKMDSIPKPAGRFASQKGAKEAPIKNLSELTSEMVANDPDIPSLDGPVQ